MNSSSPSPCHRSTGDRCRFHATIVMAIALTVAGRAGGATAQDPPQANWVKIEASDDFKKFQDQVKKGEFDATARAFLERVALPQLGAEGNRKQIERIRRRMRDVVLNARTIEPAAFEQLAKAAVDGLTAQARNPQVEPVVGVNAMLLVGEIRGKDDRPWAGAAQPLAAAMADAKLPPAIRVAAAAGLAKHLDAARTAATPDPALVQAAAKSLQMVVSSPALPADGAAGDWLVSRALDMLPAVTPKASPELAVALLGILSDASRPVDVRVRAAAALGTTASKDAGIDAAAAINAVQRLAVEALDADVTTAAERAMKARMSGQPMMPMGGRGYEGGPSPSAFGGEFGGGGTGPIEEDPIEALVVRRDAWRRMTLANAVASADGSTGFAALATGDAAARGQTLAQTLRDSANALDQTPDAAAVKQALADLQRLGRAAAPAPAAAPQPAADRPAQNDPFGAGN
jgi:hypothetical protein